MIYKDILELIGHTPIVEVKSFDVGVCRLFLKLENLNPSGAIKDRIGLSMIEAAEREGKIKKGYTLIEATAGNTGLGLALVAARKGYRLLLVIPDKMSQEKIACLKAMGAEIVMTRSDVEKGHPEYYQDYALRLSKEIPNSFFVDQFNNPANPLAHVTTTGPEIWEQMDHKVDAISVGVGSAGTIRGLTDYFRKVHPGIEFVLADPEGSVLVDHVTTGKFGTAGSWRVEGIGEDFIPAQADFSLVKKAYSISDKEAFLILRDLLRKEGILAGSSTGVLLGAAIRYAKEQKTPKNIVTFVCDSGNKYLSKVYNDHWLLDQGLLERKEEGDLRDLITRTYSSNSVVSVRPEDSVATAYSRMKLYDISQLPVIDHGKAVGIIDESDLLLAFEDLDTHKFEEKVAHYMATDPEVLSPREDLKSLVAVLKKGYTAIIQDEDKFYGVVTRIDLLNYLKRKRDV
ncbi:MAG: pyridoxal-phosphate dependent enzyme [Candidatus Omnitrophica bacterium]|nr:pyridoxal-phosphate dependent enzyme [Candidatus Omnitrophota bacterium]